MYVFIVSSPESTPLTPCSVEVKTVQNVLMFLDGKLENCDFEFGLKMDNHLLCFTKDTQMMLDEYGQYEGELW